MQPAHLIAYSVVFTLIPVFLSTLTSFLKINIVLGMIKNGLGTQNTPGNLIVGVLSFSLTIFIMKPVFIELHSSLTIPFIEEIFKKPSYEQLEKSLVKLDPLKKFLLRNSGDRELSYIHKIQTGSDYQLSESVVLTEESDGMKSDKFSDIKKVEWSTVILSFVLTELKEGFSMGFLILLPFLIIDITVSLLLSGLGMYMVSPTTLTLPLKLLLFVASDSWLYLMQGLMMSYR